MMMETTADTIDDFKKASQWIEEVISNEGLACEHCNQLNAARTVADWLPVLELMVHRVKFLTTYGEWNPLPVAGVMPEGGVA